ncbi:hypothetical protein K470DRAFT_261671 [Piedraia hortae CBS 480.64]|uniref:Uncharacterized protein n=1 Tax=Piedraia hortae CBS 480.64 TaxID=1314780 RepID=A0A6A7C9V7_9PEZI|nr:hypothetical protein K470DRAFT_261671 [Piedraia hortae CBS 480.64]
MAQRATALLVAPKYPGLLAAVRKLHPDLFYATVGATQNEILESTFVSQHVCTTGPRSPRTQSCLQLSDRPHRRHWSLLAGQNQDLDPPAGNLGRKNPNNKKCAVYKMAFSQDVKNEYSDQSSALVEANMMGNLVSFLELVEFTPNITNYVCGRGNVDNVRPSQLDDVSQETEEGSDEIEARSESSNDDLNDDCHDQERESYLRSPEGP